MALTITNNAGLELSNICSMFAGGFCEEGVECIVYISTTSGQNTTVKVVVGNPGDNTPESLAINISRIIDVKLEDMSIKFFQICGGLDGKPLADMIAQKIK